MARDRCVRLLDLPTEVLAAIVYFCAASSNRRHCVWNYPTQSRTLQSLSLTCQRLRAIALPRLYQRIQISDNLRRVTAFLRRTQTSPHLADLVHELELFNKPKTRLALASANESVPPEFQYESSIWRGFQQFRNLRELVLFNDMVALLPAAYARLPSTADHDNASSPIFPSLHMCSFQYAWSNMDPLRQDIPVACLLPFWTAPQLFSFSIGGEGLHIVSSTPSCTGRVASQGLADVEYAVIRCQIDREAVDELKAHRTARWFSEAAALDDDSDEDFINHVDSFMPTIAALDAWYARKGRR